jgi:glycerol-3-phosphate acyltransferase PlsX
MRRIAFDAMGGDHAPEPELDAAVAVSREGRKDIGITLVGDEAQIREGLARRGASVGAALTIRHAPEVIRMDDHPSVAVKAKKQSSMRVAFDLVKAGEANAVVSAGNSGAMLACGLLVWRRLPGAIRPGIGTTFPTLDGECVLCDMGANVDVQASMLAQFGVLGAAYARTMHGKPRPKLGLLANGEEESKGTDLTREANAILRSLGGATLEYVGYVEGRDIFGGRVDAIATDGFTGNVVLKTAEGAAQALVEMLKRAFASSPRAQMGYMLAKPALQKFKRRLDYAETGGAPLLGVDHLALICHGRSNATALKNAIHAAARYLDKRLVENVAEALARADVGQSQKLKHVRAKP